MWPNLLAQASPTPRPSSGVVALQLWIHLPALLIITLFSTWFLSHTMDFGIDDPFITFRYAQNLVLGNGPVFNVGERYLGTTAPGFALLLAGISWLVSVIIPVGAELASLDIPHLARYLSALSAGIIGLSMYSFSSRAFPNWRGRLFGIVLAGYVITLPAVADTVGHETLFCIALTLLGLVLWPRHMKLAALILGLAALVRPDATLAFVAAVVLTGVAHIIHYRTVLEWKQPASSPSTISPTLRQAISFTGSFGIAGSVRRPLLSPREAGKGATSLLPFFVPLAAWAIFALLFYGSPLPGTLLAKRAEALLGLWDNVSLTVLIRYVLGAIGGLTLPFALGSVCGLGYALINRSWLGSVILWASLHLALYSVIGTSFWYWYATPLVVTFVLVGGLGLLALLNALWTTLDHMSKRWHRLLVLPSLTVFVAILALELAGALRQPPAYNGHIYSFDEVVAFLHRESPAGTSIATPEPGSLGYLLGPRYFIVDTLGLSTPGVSEHILQRDFEWPYLRYQPEWVLISWHGANSPLSPDEVIPWFATTYIKTAEFRPPYFVSHKLTLRLYRRVKP